MAEALSIGGFTDHHVHLQLVDVGLLESSRLGRGLDLGSDPVQIARIAGAVSERFGHDPHGIAISYAGAFLTPTGGYPSDRSWAPAGSVRELDDLDGAVAAVAEMKAAGASVIKIASNSTAGPVFSDELVAGIVRAADEAGLPVVAHAEGPGEAQRMPRLGVRALAHAPFTERLSDDEVARQAGRIAWISTLGIHEGEAREIAIDNVRRFHAHGGTVRYGTDMGNGDTPVDLNPAEVGALREAGIRGAALIRALVPVAATAGRRFLLPARDADPFDVEPVHLEPVSLEPVPLEPAETEGTR
ncbi:hydrolase [uncultured Microbacterium sp.]|uniref:amidohydrolase family protein n=1 Tax=uncultured Microbacterium sp. TaxID=191216 RepID=UPI0025DC4384|nr:hydrolase [uncultured Microbacterium sp.]MBS1900491.1 hydrolase [Actinomycetota bacterium]